MRKRTLAWMALLALVSVTATACTLFSSKEPPPSAEEILTGAQGRLNSVTSLRGDATVSGPGCGTASVIMRWTDQPALSLRLIGLAGGQATEQESVTHGGATYSRLSEDDPWVNAPSELLPTDVDIPAIAQMSNVAEITEVDLGSATAYRLEGRAAANAIGPTPKSVTVPAEVDKTMLVHGETWEVMHSTSSFSTAEGDCRVSWEFQDYDGVPRMNPPTVAAP